MSTKFEILVMIMKIILTKKVSYCSHYFSFGQHYSCNLTDRQAFFIMEASTDQKNFHVIMTDALYGPNDPSLIIELTALV